MSNFGSRISGFFNAGGATSSGTVTSVGLVMPSGFNVSNSPIVSSGDITVTGAGTPTQYIRGDGTLANFPTSIGGGASVSYYFNGSVSQGTIDGIPYYQLSSIPVIGTGTTFVRTNAQGNGLIAAFITDAGVPNQINIPSGNWNLELYFSLSSSGGSPNFYLEIYKYDGASFTLIVTDAVSPESITTTAVGLYLTSITVPTTSLALTDRIAIRVFVNTGGRTVTLHTEDQTTCQVITTFTTGLTALNGLTAQVQTFATGTSGTDFNISSATSTHTFNLPTASATNRGALSSADWTTFNNKVSSVSGTSPIVSSGGTTPAISIPQSSGSVDGYLSSGDWTTFNGKQNQLNGTGFVKASGTTISYDNSTYLLASAYDYLIATSYQALGSTIKGFNLAVPTITNATGGLGLTSQQMRVVGYYLVQAATITGVKYYSVTGGVYTGNNYNGAGLYTYSGGALTLVASTTNDANFWTPTQGWVTKPFSATYSAAAGIYYIGFIYSNSAQTTAPSIGTSTAANSNGFQTVDFTNSAKIQGALASQTSLPSNPNISSFGANTGNPLILLY